MSGAAPVAFLDRDGTVNEEIGYLHDPALLTLLPHSAEGIRLLRSKGWKVFIVTNQAGIARGYTSEDTVRAIHRRLSELLRGAGTDVDGIYYCPHHPLQQCGCRKPRPGLVEQAIRETHLAPSRMAVVGDKASDMGLAREVGASAVLVTTGYGQETLRETTQGPPDHVAGDLLDAVRWMVGETR